MGADLLLTYCTYPHRADGTAVVVTPLVLAELSRRLDALDTEAVLTAWEDGIGGLPARESDSLDVTEDDSDDVVAGAIRARVLEVLPEAFSSSRDTLVLRLGPRGQELPYLFTGGMSWGDNPTDSYDDVSVIAELRITDDPIPESALTDQPQPEPLQP